MFKMSIIHEPGSLFSRFIALAQKGTLAVTANISAPGSYSDGTSFTRIIAKQRALGRDPWFVTYHERQDGMHFVRLVIASWIKGTGVESAAQRFADYFLDVVKRHIRDGRSKDGEMTPLSRGYERAKLRAVGDMPILVRTGQLLNALRVFVTRESADIRYGRLQSTSPWFIPTESVTTHRLGE